MHKTISAALIASATVALPAQAYEASQLEGTWCFYEQEAAGSIMPEKVTITLQDDGSYQWSEPLWKQDGAWSVDHGRLEMTGVGQHRLVAVNARRLEMTRGSTMRWRKGACN